MFELLLRNVEFINVIIEGVIKGKRRRGIPRISYWEQIEEKGKVNSFIEVYEITGYESWGIEKALPTRALLLNVVYIYTYNTYVGIVPYYTVVILMISYKAVCSM